MKYEVILNGHEEIEGATAAAVLRELMKVEFPGSRQEPAAYMRRVAKRHRMVRPETRIRATSARVFLNDLEAAGLLRRLD
jgi:hypothetical protein